MFSLSHRFFEPFKALFSASLSMTFFSLFIMFFPPANIAHCLELSFAWDENTEPDLAGYRVFFRQEGQDYDYSNPVWEGTETTCTIYGLDDDITYYFVSRAYDDLGYESNNSIELNYNPITTGDQDGGGCFIATAAYGSSMESQVKILRQFRDRFLLTNSTGRAFVRLYCTYSPSLANFISKHKSLRMVVRWSLLPIVGMSWSLLNFGFLPTALFLLLLSTIISIGLIYSHGLKKGFK